MTNAEVPAARRELLLWAYAAFNARDLEALVSYISEDADWPDDSGGRLRGRDAVRAYWAEQWTRTHDEPVGIDAMDDGRTAVRINLVVRGLDGSVLSSGRFLHRVRVESGRVSQLHIEGLPDS